jgi:hypothetical protein
MKVHNLSIDSSQRDTNVYAHANSYVVTLKNPIYDVTEMKLVSARIPTPQLITCATNKTFSVDGVDITLDETNYTSGAELASDLDLKLESSSNVDTVTFDTDTNSLIFSNTLAGDNNFTFEFYSGTNGYTNESSTSTTPHQVLGFDSRDYTSTSNVLRSGAINISGPNSLVLKLTAGSDEFTQSVYTSTPFYTGHILLDGTSAINVLGNDDTLVHHFHSGPQKYIKDIRVEFFYMSHGRLIPYDFRNQEHVLKFEVTCSTDKLESLSKLSTKTEEEKTVEKIKKPATEILYNQEVYIYIGIIVFVGMVLMLLMKRKPT